VLNPPPRIFTIELIPSPAIKLFGWDNNLNKPGNGFLSNNNYLILLLVGVAI
jgi:hypothetical protein